MPDIPAQSLVVEALGHPPEQQHTHQTDLEGDPVEAIQRFPVMSNPAGLRALADISTEKVSNWLCRHHSVMSMGVDTGAATYLHDKFALGQVRVPSHVRAGCLLLHCAKEAFGLQQQGQAEDDKSQ